MKVSVDQRDGRTAVVSVAGEVDLQTSPRLRQTLLETLKDRARVVVDLSGVDYIDSSGITSLLEALKEARETSCAFVLAHVSEGAMRVIQLGRLDKVFTIRASVDDALAATG